MFQIQPHVQCTMYNIHRCSFQLEIANAYNFTMKQVLAVHQTHACMYMLLHLADMTIGKDWNVHGCFHEDAFQEMITHTPSVLVVNIFEAASHNDIMLPHVLLKLSCGLNSLTNFTDTFMWAHSKKFYVNIFIL